MRSIDKKLVRSVVCRIELDGEKYEIKEPTLKQTLERLKKVQEFSEYEDSIREKIKEDPNLVLEFNLRRADFMIDNLSILTGLDLEIVEKMSEDMMDQLLVHLAGGEEEETENKKKAKQKKVRRGGK